MVTEKEAWWEKRSLRSVDNLKLWIDNPRLDPVESHDRLSDFIEDLIQDDSEKKDFMDLIASIATRGFQSFDPIVVWKNENDKFVVAEGNRRVLALKLLRNPDKAPKVLRRFIRESSRYIDRDSIEKIRVCVAPSYEDTRWYILQRHSTGSLLKRWQRLQQQRFILSVYEEANHDLDLTIERTGFKKGEIVEALRFVGLRDLAVIPAIFNQLTSVEQDAASSHRINMTVLERWFGKKLVKESWGIEFDEMNIVIKSIPSSFYNAYAKFLKLMINPHDNELGFAITTRTIDNNFDTIFEALPTVEFPSKGDITTIAPENITPSNPPGESPNLSDGKTPPSSDNSPTPNVPRPELKANPNRNQLTSDYYQISVSSYKIAALFRELQKLPVARYKNVTAAALRVFLDLSVDEFIKVNELDSVLAKQENKAYNEVTLMRRLQFLQKHSCIKDNTAKKVIKELLTHNNDFSLNTLNDYVHGVSTHKVTPSFINRFWDMLTPLFKVLIDLKEK